MRRRFELSLLRALAIIAALTVVVASCRSSSGPQLDANTNWLRLCDIDSDCVEAGQCICGVCSNTCTSDAQCLRGDVASACVTSRSGAHGHRCAQDDKLRATPICLPSCSNGGGCGPGFYCEADACWPETARGVTQSIGSSRDLSEYDAAVSFATAVALPDPELAIRTMGSGVTLASDLAGAWEASLESSSADVISEGVPLRLEVRGEPNSGRWIGIVSLECKPGKCEATDVLARSTPDAVAPMDADLTRQRLIEGLDYRVFDGVISELGFSFWISNNELWSDWCTAQSPQRIEVDGKPGYACGESGGPFPMRSGRDALCTVDFGACSCTETSCRLNPYTMTTSFDLNLTKEGALQGTGKFLSYPPVSITFTRMQGAQP